MRGGDHLAFARTLRLGLRACGDHASIGNPNLSLGCCH